MSNPVMAQQTVCWLAFAIATIGVSAIGMFLREVWRRLSVCEEKHWECERKLNEVETKLLMLESWKERMAEDIQGSNRVTGGCL